PEYALQLGARLLDLACDAMSAAGLGDRGRLLEQRQRLVMVAVPGGNVSQPHQVRGYARHEPDIPAQPHRFLQPLPRRVQPARAVLGDAQVPEHLGHGPLVTDLRRELVRLLKNRNRGVVVLPNDLMEAADPEQRLTLAAHIAELAVQLRRPLEQRQFARVLGQPLLFLVELHKESGVNDPATGQGKISLDRVQFPIGGRQCAGIATVNGAFVEQPGAFDPVFRAHRRHRLPRLASLVLWVPWCPMTGAVGGEAGVTAEITAFANARIFDGSSAELREGCVRVASGTIVEVGGGPDPGDRVIDCRGRAVVPGLIDAHFHAYGASLSLLEIETSPLSYLALAGARRLAGALGRGFTTVRDPGGGDAGLAQAIREGLAAAPRYLFCGAALSQTGGHGDPRPPELGCCLGGGHMAEVVDGVDALRRAARERLRSGAHAIKIMASGGVISPSDPLRVPQYSPEEIVVVEEATRRGSYVAAHAYSAEAIGVAVANGVRSIEHGNLLDAPTAALMAEQGAFLVPTLVTYDAMERRGAELGLAPVARAKNREVLDAGRTAIMLAREAGVRIGFGTDLMGTLDG